NNRRRRMSRTMAKTFKRARGTKESAADPRTKLRKGLKGTRGEVVTAPRRQRQRVDQRRANEKHLVSPVHCGTRADHGLLRSELHGHPFDACSSSIGQRAL